MAVMQNSIIFGGIDSADFGIYIGGEGTFDAPKRDVEMISIPGRNGAFALDKGRFENIEVTYSAFNHEPDLATFSAQLEGFRNAICSQKGYQRLTDTFHPDEYRMAAYIDGLEIKPIEYNTAATFDIKFDCKPQRYLLSGEEAIDVTSGEVILNPTLFESSPMLEVEGYGNIQFNGYEIDISYVPIGRTILKTAGSADFGSRTATEYSWSFAGYRGNVATGDSIFFDRGRKGVSFSTGGYGSSPGVTMTWTHSNPDATDSGNCYSFYLDNLSFVVGTPKTITNTVSITATYQGTTENPSWTGTLDYDGDSTFTFTVTSVRSAHVYFSSNTPHVSWDALYGDSSVLALGHPTYIDCDLGEAYMLRWDGKAISLNPYIDLGSDLPKLAVGSNEITFDNTITDLKVIPRWWRV